MVSRHSELHLLARAWFPGFRLIETTRVVGIDSVRFAGVEHRGTHGIPYVLVVTIFMHRKWFVLQSIILCSTIILIPAFYVLGVSLI
jgi:hypothetical protein